MTDTTDGYRAIRLARQIQNGERLAAAIRDSEEARIAVANLGGSLVCHNGWQHWHFTLGAQAADWYPSTGRLRIRGVSRTAWADTWQEVLAILTGIEQ